MKTRDMITILTCVPDTNTCAHCPSQTSCISISSSTDFNQQVAQRLSDLLLNLNKTTEQLEQVKAERAEWQRNYNRLARDVRAIVYEHQLVED